MTQVQLNPKINTIPKGSLLETIYMQLYKAFFEAQRPKTEDFPQGIVEGDETSIRLRNTAYTFASNMVLVINENNDQGGGVGRDSLNKKGDSMLGGLEAHYGFSAGIGGKQAIYIKEVEQGGVKKLAVVINGDLEVDSKGLMIDGKNALSFKDGNLQLNGESIKIPNELVVGDNALIVSGSEFTYDGKKVYHEGNANKKDIDWSSKNSTVHGNLDVNGGASVDGELNASSGVSISDNGAVVFTANKDTVSSALVLDSYKGFSISKDIIISSTDGKLNVGSKNTSLVLGANGSNDIRLNASLKDTDGKNTIISKTGKATFHNGVSMKHDFGEDVFSTYRNSNDDEGVIAHKFVQLGVTSPSRLSSSDKGVVIGIKKENDWQESTVNIQESTSKNRLAEQNHKELSIETIASLLSVYKPLEAQDYVGIRKSLTKLTENGLFFNNNSQISSKTDGVVLFGNTYLKGNITSEKFTSGFAGYGWGATKDVATGDYNITADSMTIRKKLRVYEMEVSKIAATNGSLWVSSSFDGDTVQKIN